MHELRYTRDEPDFLPLYAAAPEMQRLKDVGMNCGCEYTNFPWFRELASYSRYRHSLGTARIVWHFTRSRAQTLAALFHDIATPAFAHTIDFMHGDYLQQEYTEGRTEFLISHSHALMRLLAQDGIAVADVADYHRYPIADNDSPRLSADRLEYTLGNLAGYGLQAPDVLQDYYDDLCVGEDGGTPELAFRHADIAAAFGFDSLKTSRIYVADEDRYAMQRLSEIVARAVEKGVLTPDALYTTESAVIARLCADDELRSHWERFRALHEMLRDEAAAPEADRRVIPAKRRCIDPLIAGQGRLSAVNPAYAAALQDFLRTPQTGWLCAR